MQPNTALVSFRTQLTVGEDIVDPLTWAGSVWVAHGIAPRVRVGRTRWFNLLSRRTPVPPPTGLGRPFRHAGPVSSSTRSRDCCY